jgi:hypothetical protein
MMEQDIVMEFFCTSCQKVVRVGLKDISLEDEGCGYDGDFSTHPVMVVYCGGCEAFHTLDINKLNEK